MASRRGTLLLWTMIFLAVPCLSGIRAQTSDEVTVPQQQELSSPNINQVELTADSARRSIDTFLEMQGKYGESAFDDPSDPKAFVEAMKTAGIYDKVAGDVKQHGFKGVEDWAKTFASVGLAASFVREGQDAGSVDRQIADLEKDGGGAAGDEGRDHRHAAPDAADGEQWRRSKALLDDPAYKDKVDRVLTMDNSGEVE